MLSGFPHVSTQMILDESVQQRGLVLAVLRLDAIHPTISGNKWYKLHYFISRAIDEKAVGIVSFGGPWSNHLVATAAACHALGLPCAGIVRGEKPLAFSTTLQACLQYGMELHFVSRTLYQQKQEPDFLSRHVPAYEHYLPIPEGGFSELGAAGAALIRNQFDGTHYTHICCAAGTGTTAAGLLLGAQKHQQVIAIPVLKNLQDLRGNIEYLTKRSWSETALHIASDYHFGGYAKNTPALVSEMNAIYRKHGLPTDFVYTAKMMSGVFDLIHQGFFPAGSSILCIHTGGLQGNRSLPGGTLIF